MRPVAVLLASVLLAAGFAALAPPASSLPTPGLFCAEARETTGRYFPEAMETNDYVGFREASACLDLLAQANPDIMTIHAVAESAGWDTAAGGHDTFEVKVVEITNTKSNISRDDKLVLLFQLSIHGNEKGGREGGLRMIEDLVTGAGIAAERPELVGYLDYMVLLFVLPNPDGWVHEEPEYRADCPNYTAIPLPPDDCVETQNFVRVNGNGFDLNRNSPTVGWVFEGYQVLSQPETQGLVNFTKTHYPRIHYASDIHGMLQPADMKAPGFQEAPSPVPVPVVPGGVPDPSQIDTDTRGHFVLTMLPAGRQDQEEMTRTTALAERIKERLNTDPAFAEWQQIPQSLGVWGGEFNDWGTVWDTIGYTDSGFTSDFYAQDIGLNAPGVDFELAYNHITFDNYYPGLAQRVNAYHIESVRVIVASFMDQAALDIQQSIEVKGHRTAYLANPKVVTNKDDGPKALSGWAAENIGDDGFDLAHRTFEATPNDYFVDMAKFLRDGDKPATFDPLTATELTSERLAGYDTFIIGGSAYDGIAGKAGPIGALKAFVERGGNLVVTDSALKILEELGIASPGGVDVHFGYAGNTNFLDHGHELVAGVRGLARQTYEPVPLGYGIDGNTAPIWFVTADAFTGEAVGVSGEGQVSFPDASKVNYGRATLGSGTVHFLGALLPDPTEEQYHPYGLDSYSTTYTGNQLLRNMLGFDVVFAEEPAVLDNLGKSSDLEGNAGGNDAGAAANGTPGPAVGLVLASVALLVWASRRRA